MVSQLVCKHEGGLLLFVLYENPAMVLGSRSTTADFDHPATFLERYYIGSQNMQI
jgi:hypothetical protein